MATFKTTSRLMGIVPKTGSGVIESNGQKWSHDHVELHLLQDLDSDKGALGQSTQIFKLQDCSANFDRLKSFVGQPVVVESKLVTSGKGGSPVLTVVDVTGAAK